MTTIQCENLLSYSTSTKQKQALKNALVIVLSSLLLGAAAQITLPNAQA